MGGSLSIRKGVGQPIAALAMAQAAMLISYIKLWQQVFPVSICPTVVDAGVANLSAGEPFEPMNASFIPPC
jgi:hypothetical protein